VPLSDAINRLDIVFVCCHDDMIGAKWT
jgi:hypothetical protein